MDTQTRPALSMAAEQAVELLVNDRRRGTIAIPATYAGDFEPGSDAPPRRLTGAEREEANRASRLLADAVAGTPVDEERLQDAVHCLRRLSAESAGESRFRLADGRLIAARDVTFRARLD